MHIYLDNAASTRIRPEAAAAMAEAAEQYYGNPSARHKMGLAAGRLLKKARRKTAALINAAPEEIIFTSGGTEANNMAIIGGANPKVGRHIVASLIEHPSVINPLKRLEREEGFQISWLKPTWQGRINPERFGDALRPDTSLVCVMHTNNETGAVQPIHLLKDIMKEKCPRALLFTDAVQAYGKQALDPAKLGVDLLSASAHKLHGPRGVGLLYIRRGCVIRPLMMGGGQENKLRPGTENLPAIVGFGAAAELCGEEDWNHVARMGYFLRTAMRRIDGAEMNSPHDGVPGILNIAFPPLPSEVMLNALSDVGIYASSASACSGSRVSSTLKAMGFSNAPFSLRFSISPLNSMQEMGECYRACDYLYKSLLRW